ncbi:MAG: hypothetical protein IJ119_00875, partial [Clostridia bacterium]|nr:hypothetical protein [Clostridia bacterium]
CKSLRDLFDSKETAVVTTFLGPLNKRNPSGFLPSLTPKTYNLKPKYGFVAARQIRICPFKQHNVQQKSCP